MPGGSPIKGRVNGENTSPRELTLRSLSNRDRNQLKLRIDPDFDSDFVKADAQPEFWCHLKYRHFVQKCLGPRPQATRKKPPAAMPVQPGIQSQ